MSYWRWLLFAAMARLELREDLYFRIQNAKTIRRDVKVDVCRDGDPDTSGEVSYADSGRHATLRAAKSRAAAKQLFT